MYKIDEKMSLLVLLELVRDKCKVSAKLSYLRISLHALISEQAGRTEKGSLHLSL